MIYFLQLLFPYIVLFYFVDCFIYVRKNQLAYSSHFGKKFHIQKPGLRFIGFSPFCRVYIFLRLPIFFSEKGIYIWSLTDTTDFDLYVSEFFDYIPFEEIKKIQCNENEITINEHISINLHSSLDAMYLSEKIHFLKGKPAEKRLKEIKRILEDETDLEKIKKIRSDFSDLFFSLELLSTLLFIYIFIFIPLVLYFRFPLNISFLFLSIFVIYLLIIIFSSYYYKKTFGDYKKTLSLFFSLVLSPITAIHVIHNLTKYSLFRFNCIALSFVLLSDEDLKRVLKKELQRIHYSKLKCNTDDLIASISSKERCLNNLISNVGISKQELFKPPVKQDSAAASYCPLCEVEFVDGVNVCSECTIELKDFIAVEELMDVSAEHL